MRVPETETLAVVAVVIPLITGAGLLVLLIIALGFWWHASAAAEREWRESERAQQRSSGDVLTAIRESHQPGR